MFVAMGLSAIFPVMHGLMLYGVTSMERRIGLSWLVLQGFLYIVGAGIYAVSDCPLFLLAPYSVTMRLIYNRLGYRSV